MTQVILGFDTSCYQTSCAMVSLDGALLAESRKMLVVPDHERGLRQSEAVFQHIKQLPDVLKECIGHIKRFEMIAVCASSQPVPLPDSYMPVFHAGVSFARAIAATHQVPCFLTSHQEGHFAAAGMAVEGLPDNHLAVHLSGGTTEIVRVRFDGYTSIGKTLDISAGQLLDRVGVRMEYPFPAGASVEKLALGQSVASRYPAIVKGASVSFSGIETAALRDLDDEQISHASIAAELFDAIARSVSKMIIQAAEQTQVYDVLITGGVASSKLLRAALDERLAKRVNRIKTYYGLPEYAGDNAVGVALIGCNKYILHKENDHGNCIKRERTV